MKDKKLYRELNGKMIGGVFSGLEAYTGIDQTLLRLLYVFLSIFSAFFPGILVYIVAVIIIPTREDVERKTFHEAEYEEKKDSNSESIFD